MIKNIVKNNMLHFFALVMLANNVFAGTPINLAFDTHAVSPASVNMPMSSIVNIDGGVIAPKQVLKISLSKLVEGINYTLTCKILDEKHDDHPSAIKFYGSYDYCGDVFFNGEKVVNSDQPCGYRTILPKVDNTLIISSVDKWLTFSFYNYDENDNVTVYSCKAIANTPLDSISK